MAQQAKGLAEFVAEEDLRGIIRKLQQQLARAKVRNEELAEATVTACKEAVVALGPMPPVDKPARDVRKKGAEVALWDMGDWQGGKRTVGYNSDVMVQRVEYFWNRAERITDIQRADHPVKKVAIIFGGDMMEGLFQFPTQAFEIDSTLFTQFTNVSTLLVRTVRQALSMYDEVEVFAEWGNHGRIGSKRETIPRSDNMDRMCYEMARQLLASEKRLRWVDCPDDIQRCSIGNYRFLVIHGDEVGRNGYVSQATMINHVNRWKSGALNPWFNFQDVYCHHYHRHAEEPMANGEGRIFWTGSTESENRYANETLAADSIPSQRIHFIDTEKGRVTSQHKIFLD